MYITAVDLLSYSIPSAAVARNHFSSALRTISNCKIDQGGDKNLRVNHESSDLRGIHENHVIGLYNRTVPVTRAICIKENSGGESGRWWAEGRLYERAGTLLTRLVCLGSPISITPIIDKRAARTYARPRDRASKSRIANRHRQIGKTACLVTARLSARI